MKSGFTIIEVLVAFSISAALITILFNFLGQSRQVMSRVDDYVDLSTKLAIVQHQMERDIQGVFIPVQARKAKKKEGPKSEAKPNKEPKKAEEKVEAKKPKPLEKVFYSENRNNTLGILTFITSNPLQVYWSKQVGKAKPRVARVIYRLEEDKKNKGSYTLFRQESYELDYDAIQPGEKKAARLYELADGIKSFAVSYMIVEKSKDDVKEGETEKKKEYKTVKEWKDQKVDDEKEEEENQVPNLVRISITFWQADKERSKTFEFTIPVLADVSPMKEREEKKKKKPASQKMVVITLPKGFSKKDFLAALDRRRA